MGSFSIWRSSMKNFFPLFLRLTSSYSIVGGLLASGLLSINSIGSVTSWRKIFLVEGIITIAIGILSVFFLPGHPKTSRLLTEDERVLVLEGTATKSGLSGASRRGIQPRLILRAFTFHAGLCALSYLINNIISQGLVIFLPTIIVSLGKFTTVEAQLRTVPP